VRFERPEIITLHGFGCRFSISNWNADEHTLQSLTANQHGNLSRSGPRKSLCTRDFSGLDCEASGNTADTREGIGT
jgi:hypothetical protein